MEHLNDEQLDALVMGASPDEAVERHLVICEACARRLMRAAQFESELYDAAATASEGVGVSVRPRPAPAQRWRIALPIAGALAVVVFGAWSLVSREKPGDVSPRATTVREPSMGSPDVAEPSTARRVAHEMQRQDVCRCVTVQPAAGPPTDPGGSQLCPPASAP